MRNNIVDKSILLIAEPFYGYDKAIKNELIRLGAKSVYLKKDVHYKGNIRARFNISNLKEWLKNPFVRKQWTDNFMKEIEGIFFDTLFVVEVLPFSKNFFEYIRKANPNIRIILFLWDSLRYRQSRFIDYLPKFDKVYSFDRDDALKYKLSYYPDFYIEVSVPPLSDCKYDIAFIGTMNETLTSFRGEILKKIDNFCKKNALVSFFYLKYDDIELSKNILKRLITTIIHSKYLKKLRNLTNCNFMHKDKLPLSEFNGIISNTRVVLDINHHERQGMTINAITAIALGKKLITTNKRIKEEDFYNPAMIYVIDECNPILDLEFFSAHYVPIDIKKLRIDNWLTHIVNEED